MVRCRIVNQLRTEEISEHVAAKKLVRLGRLEKFGCSGIGDPRQKFVEFAHERHKNRLFEAADRMKTTTSEEITMEPIDATIGRIKPRDTKCRSS